VSLCALLVCLVLLHYSHHSHHVHHMAVLYVHIIPYALLYQIISILKALYADTLQWTRGVSGGVSEGVSEGGSE
jgi:Co/Zn/Cd efflux system component